MSFGKWIGNFSQVSWVKSIVYFLIIFVAGGIILHTNHKQYAKDLTDSQLNRYLAMFMSQPVQTIDAGGHPFWGNPDADIVIVEFSDFECPYCKRAAFTLKPLLAPYRDKVKLVYMNYPLDTSCNKVMLRSLHRYSCNAAYAAYCAGRQGKVWEYHDEAFDRQPKFQAKSLENIAEKLKLNMNDFKACLTDEATKQTIVEDIDMGNQLQVRGTPTIFVNGRPFQAWMSKKAWKAVIEKLESEQKKNQEDIGLNGHT